MSTTLQRPTPPGALAEVARHVVLPTGIVSTGWPAVRDKARDLGVTFDPWQDGAGQVILSKRADGSYACSIGGVVISIPRQVGKTFLIGAIVFALCLLNPGLTVIWTAHHTTTSNQTFQSMQGFACCSTR
jgi:phage terminase large subunit-like protein